jgi:hypothetical protein
MKRIIGGKVYNTETANQVASDCYWDGHNFERRGRNTYLYKTAKGNFFLHRTTLWQGERNTIEAIGKGEAKQWYEDLPETEMEYEDAFGIVPEEA